MVRSDKIGEATDQALGCRQEKRGAQLLRAFGEDVAACAGVAAVLTVLFVAFSTAARAWSTGCGGSCSI